MIDAARRAEGAGGASPSGPPQGISARKKGGAALFAALLVASPAAAEQSPGWAAFLQHCLTPMANVALTQPVGLTQTGALKNDDHGLAVYSDDARRFELRISEGLNADGRREDGRAICNVIVEGAGAEVANDLLAWSSQPEAFEMWEDVSDGGPSLILRSTTWREPKMEVWMTLGETRIILRATETDLES